MDCGVDLARHRGDEIPAPLRDAECVSDGLHLYSGAGKCDLPLDHDDRDPERAQLFERLGRLSQIGVRTTVGSTAAMGSALRARW